MTAIQVRTEAAQADNGADVLLDWFDKKSASTVAYEPAFLKDLAPSAVACDLLRLGGAVYCADKAVKRAAAPDAWTRNMALQLPVSNVALWNGARDELVGALSFLSGDRWELTFVADTQERHADEPLTNEFDAVSLFSGGLDSLAGVIELLEAGRRVTLVGHHDSGLTDSKQKELCGALASHYGPDRVKLRRLYLGPTSRRAGRARPLSRGFENTTRARSFLFFAAGIAVTDALGAAEPLYVPENGFIGINVPLTPARAGSLSTRTTHPLYMHRMHRTLDLLGLQHRLENPFRLLTKGEVLERSPNGKLLLRLAPRSVSCSHPEAPRWVERPQGNCGYCYPCLIRRASMHHVGLDRANDYAWDALTDADLLRRSTKRGRSLRALAASLGQDEHREDVLANGRIPGGETEAFYGVYRRGRAELRAWLASAGPALKRRLR